MASAAALRTEEDPVNDLAAEKADVEKKATGTEKRMTFAGKGGALRVGSKGEDVKQLQEFLGEHGYDIKADSIFGPRTEQAVEDFQKQREVKVDGVVGKQTKKALFDAANLEDNKMKFGANWSYRPSGGGTPPPPADPGVAAGPAASDPAPAPPDLRESPVSPDEAPAFAGDRKPGKMDKGPIQRSFGLPPTTEMKVGVPPGDVEVAGMGGRILEEASDPLTALKRPKAAARRVLTPTREAEIQETKAAERGDMTSVAASLYSLYRSGEEFPSVQDVSRRLSYFRDDLSPETTKTFLDRMVRDKLITPPQRSSIEKQLLSYEAEGSEMPMGPMGTSFGLPPATEMKVGVPATDVEAAGMGGRILEEASEPLTALRRPKAAARRVLTPTREAEIKEKKADLRGEMTPVAAAMYSFYRSGQADGSVQGIVQGLSANQKDLTEADVDTFLDRMVSDRLISSAKRAEILKQLMRNEAVEADTGTAGMAALQ